MKMLPHPPLPLANTAAFTAARPFERPAAEPWQHALQRAFGAATATAAGAVQEPPTETYRHGAASGSLLPGNALPLSGGGRDAAATHPIATPVGRPAAYEAGPHATCDGLAASATNALPQAHPSGQAKTDDASGSHSRVLRERQHRFTEGSAVRVHLEQDAHGVSVWFGLDGDASTVRLQAAAVLVELQRVLPASGQRLARVVCNGAPFYLAPHLEKETSWP